MKCTNHPKREAEGICTVCGNSFCSDCLIKVKRKNICTDCASLKLDLTRIERSATEQKPPVFQQQQQQQHTPTTEKEAPTKTNYDTVKWIIAILMFLFAIGAFQRSPISGLILIILGIYWIPPVMAWVQKQVFNGTGILLPRWFRVGASIILFIIAAMISTRGA